MMVLPFCAAAGTSRGALVVLSKSSAGRQGTSAKVAGLATSTVPLLRVLASDFTHASEISSVLRKNDFH